jgi:hypothetical protein
MERLGLVNLLVEYSKILPVTQKDTTSNESVIVINGIERMSMAH